MHKNVSFVHAQIHLDLDISVDSPVCWVPQKSSGRRTENVFYVVLPTIKRQYCLKFWHSNIPFFMNYIPTYSDYTVW